MSTGRDSFNPYAAEPVSTPLPTYAVETDVFRLSFTLDLEDYVAMSRCLCKSGVAYRRQGRRSLFRGLVVFIIGAMLILVSLSWAPWWIMGEVGFALVIVCLIFYSPWMYRRRVAQATRAMYAGCSSPLIFGPKQLMISAEGVESSGEHGMGRFRWTVVDDVLEDLDHVFILVGGIQALIVPKGAFRDAAHCVAFVAAAKRFIAAAPHPSR